MRGSKIPFINLSKQYDSLQDELLDAQDAVYRSGQVLGGVHVERFENALARYCHRKYAVCVNSGTQALIMAIQVASPKLSSILTPTVSFAASTNAVLMTDRKPLFTPVDDQGLMDINSITHSKHHNKDIGALMYVNLFGNIVDQDRLRLYSEFFNSQLNVIEDAAQSLGGSWDGRPSGSLGDVSILSFDPMKNLPNYGSGGMLLTDDEYFYRCFLNLRDNGKEDAFSVPGTNSKMSESDCAGMMVKLHRFEEWQRRRNLIAEYYEERLSDYVRVPQTHPLVQHSWHKYVIQTPARDELKFWLEEQGIETKIHYDRPLYQLDSCYNIDAYDPQAESLCSQALSLPIYPELTDAEVEVVVQTIIEYWELR